jgi:hypothetical protein
MHLQPADFVDIAEGNRPDASAPHLDACADCRRQLAEMRAMMSAAAEVEVPEPSPLFWDHLSARVGEAVAAEGTPRPAWLDVASWRHVAIPAWAVAIASVIVVVALSARLTAPEPPASAMLNRSAFTASAPPASAVPDTNASVEVLGDAASDDASLMLVASLTSAMDLDAASDAGLAPNGSAEHAVTHMADAELRELQRLLKEEMVGS